MPQRRPTSTGGLIVIAPNVQKVATGYTGRRAIVEDAALQRLPPGTRHVHRRRLPRRTAQRRHDLLVVPHAEPHQQWLVGGLDALRARDPRGAKRTVEYNWHAISNGGFWQIVYPGILARASSATCQARMTSRQGSEAAAANKQYRTVATGTYASEFLQLAVYHARCRLWPGLRVQRRLDHAWWLWLLGQHASGSDDAGHFADGHGVLRLPRLRQATAHFEINGGAIYKPRGAALAKTETCLICHGTGRIADIKASHSK